MECSRRGTWQTFDVTDGLAGGVRCILQDPQGFLWLGTGFGLCRYDGVQFQTFRQEQAALANQIMDLCLDHEGRLLVGTTQGIVVFEDGQLNPPPPELGAIKRPTTFYKSDSALWIGTNDSLWRVRGDQSRYWTIADGLPGGEIRELCMDGRGRLWIATDGGLGCLEGESLVAWTTDNGLLSDDVRSLYLDEDGSLWIGMGSGYLQRYADGVFQDFTFNSGRPGNILRSITRDPFGRLWVALWGEGIYCLQGDSIVCFTIRDGLLSNRVSTIYQDIEGVLWIGHSADGLTRFDPNSIEIITNEPVTEFCYRDRDDAIWFANEHILYRHQGRQVESFDIADRVYNMVQDSQGGFWLATKRCGLFHYAGLEALRRNEARQYTTEDGLGSNNVMAVVETSDGVIWAGTSNDGYLCRLSGDRFDSVPCPHTVIFRLYEDRRGWLWFGGFEGWGVGCWDGRRMRTYTHRDGLPGNAVQSFVEDDEGNLWIGTQDGLCRFNGLGFEIIGHNKELTSYHHQCAARDAEGYLWFGTLRGGLYRSDGEHFQWLTRADGLPSNSITGIIPCDDGSVLIGSYHGLARYRPPASPTPSVEIYEIIAHEVYRNPKHLHLYRQQADMVICRFRALSLLSQRMLYCYQLVGHDDSWRYTRNREIKFENLPVGEYTLRLKAINHAMRHSPVTEMAITIEADPWQKQQARYEATISQMRQELALRERTAQQSQVLVELAKLQLFDFEDSANLFQAITEKAAQTLKVQETSIWLHDPEKYELTLVDRYLLKEGKHGVHPPLPDARVTPYLKALDANRLLQTQNIEQDQTLQNLIPRGIRSVNTVGLLHVPFRIGGQMRGVVAFNHSDHPRHWPLDEQHFASSIADLIGLNLESIERNRVEDALNTVLSSVRCLMYHGTVQLNRVTGTLEESISVYNEHAAQQFLPLSVSPVQTYWEVFMAAREPFPHDLQRTQSIRRAAILAGRTTYHQEFRCQTIDGETRWLFEDVFVSQVKPETWRLVGVCTDITARKEAEIERIKLNSQIQQAQKLESLGVLAGGIAHDFNNLLAGILGYCGLVLMEMDEGHPAVANLQQIETAAQRAADLTRQLLAYSGKGQFVIEPIDMTELVKEMMDLLKVSISKKVNLDIDHPETLGLIRGDSTQIRQVVMNLITNASEAIGDRPGTLSVRLKSAWYDSDQIDNPFFDDALPAGHYLSLEVQDDGVGMDEKTRKRIFDPFFTTKFTGRGLGLAAVMGIVRGHNGTIQVESEPDRGTTFRVLLPLHESVVDGFVRPSRPAEPRGEDGLKLTGRIMVVDDEEAVRNLAASVLQRLGLEVVALANGMEAIDHFTNDGQEVDAVLLDLTMPELDGEETARRLQELHPDLPILLTSGYNEQATLGRFEDLKLSAFLQKPYHPRELMNLVRRVLEKREDPDLPIIYDLNE